jgi:GNAT superfamily N-acetyltransferase
VTVRLATDADVPALAALRRAWTESAEDPDFERRFSEWWERESARRVTWLAEVDSTPVGMLNMAVFERMPRPNRLTSRWGYIANVFVLDEHRNAGIGRQLLDAAIDHARANGFARLVLSPTERAVPFYRRAGFGAADELLLLPL